MFFHCLEKAMKFIYLVCYSQLQNTNAPCSVVDRIYDLREMSTRGEKGTQK